MSIGGVRRTVVLAAAAQLQLAMTVKGGAPAFLHIKLSSSSVPSASLWCILSQQKPFVHLCVLRVFVVNLPSPLCPLCLCGGSSPEIAALRRGRRLEYQSAVSKAQMVLMAAAVMQLAMTVVGGWRRRRSDGNGSSTQ